MSDVCEWFQEVKLMFPGAQRMNRGNHEINALVSACKANNVTDLVIVHETRGQPGTPFTSICPFSQSGDMGLVSLLLAFIHHEAATNKRALPMFYCTLILSSFWGRCVLMLEKIQLLCTRKRNSCKLFQLQLL